MRPPVLIVGGGLAGLAAARLLRRASIGFQLLEARGRLGGRILSVDALGDPSPDGFDLGPSWFWPRMQPAMAELVEALGLVAFPQFGNGDMLFQRTDRDAPERYPGMQQEPVSMRLAGGTGTLIAALAASLPPASIRLGARVTQATLHGQAVDVHFIDIEGTEHSLRASRVIFALPPRLLAATVSFSPALDAATSRLWRATPTWMAPHAKFFAIYDTPFWREAGLSGAAQSMAGPLVEIHDATTASGHAALFGFLGVSAEQRAAAGRDAVIAASIRQLVPLFGPRAGSPRATLYRDWAMDKLTATEGDGQAGDHPVAHRGPWVGGEWQHRISLAGSETSHTEPGYLAGAIEAGERSATEIINWLHAADVPASPSSHKWTEP